MKISTLYADTFFSAGCRDAFHDVENTSLTSCNNIVFVDFSVVNVSIFSNYDWVVSLGDSLVILVCDLPLLPIAVFFQKKFEKIIAIFTSQEPINSIVSFLENYDSQSERKTVATISLSEREFLCLSGVLKGTHASVEAKRKNLSVKTIYTHRKNIVNKLGSRKISFLQCGFQRWHRQRGSCLLLK